jgi:hypothetical protein
VSVSRCALAVLSILFSNGWGHKSVALDREGSTQSVPGASINKGRLSARSSQPFRAWGMSLAWEANDLYGGRRQAARIKDPAERTLPAMARHKEVREISFSGAAEMVLCRRMSFFGSREPIPALAAANQRFVLVD